MSRPLSLTTPVLLHLAFVDSSLDPPTLLAFTTISRWGAPQSINLIQILRSFWWFHNGYPTKIEDVPQNYVARNTEQPFEAKDLHVWSYSCLLQEEINLNMAGPSSFVGCRKPKAEITLTRNAFRIDYNILQHSPRLKVTPRSTYFNCHSKETSLLPSPSHSSAL